MIRFRTKLVKEGNFSFLYLPSSKLRTRDRLRVKGRINGHAFATSAMPWRDKQHVITVDEALRQEIGLAGGETVEIELEPDLLPPFDTPFPPDLSAALRAHPAAEMAMRGLPLAHRRYYVEWIESAKRPETRSERIEASVEMIIAGRDPFAPKRPKRGKKRVLRVRRK